MKLSPFILAIMIGGAATTAASAVTYDITLTSGDGTITGFMTVDNSGLVTSFVGTASGFDSNAVFNGPVTLGQGAGGPNFVYIDDKFTPVANYFSAGDCCSGGGLGLVTAAGYNFRIYDYTDTFNDYGVQTGWFGSSGYNPTSVSFNAVPEPATWALMALGFFGLGAAGYASRRRQAVAAV